MDANKVQVLINGEVLTLVSTEDEDYLRRLAGFIDKKMNEITNPQASIRPNMRNLLVAVNIADELFKEKDKNQKMLLENKRLQTLVDELRSALEITHSDLNRREAPLRIKEIIMTEDLLSDSWKTR